MWFLQLYWHGLEQALPQNITSSEFSWCGVFGARARTVISCITYMYEPLKMMNCAYDAAVNTFDLY